MGWPLGQIVPIVGGGQHVDAREQRKVRSDNFHLRQLAELERQKTDFRDFLVDIMREAGDVDKRLTRFAAIGQSVEPA